MVKCDTLGKWGRGGGVKIIQEMYDIIYGQHFIINNMLPVNGIFCIFFRKIRLKYNSILYPYFSKE